MQETLTLKDAEDLLEAEKALDSEKLRVIRRVRWELERLSTVFAATLSILKARESSDYFESNAIIIQEACDLSELSTRLQALKAFSRSLQASSQKESSASSDSGK